MFNFGVDYYPEQWPEERWGIDAQLMAEAGFNVVRLGEFAWARMEPADNRFDFSWLDRAIEVLASHGIRIILGTPTGSPPAWLMYQHPEAYRVRADGVRVTFGNRREYCPNNRVYQTYSRRIVSQLADHYAQHPAVIGWQIDNEFGERCYCPSCVQAFQNWLCERYNTLDVLNEKWGTIFWSHSYSQWAEIPAPLTTGLSPNPGLALDYARFASDSYVAYQQFQIDILREKCPGQLITHNFMGFGYENINYFDLASSLDFVSWDNYPRMQWSFQQKVNPATQALSADTMRGLKHQNFWVMEQQSGSGGWEIVSVAPRPGELRLWAYQAIAHGADGILFFRWRTARYGTEQYWHGILDHDGTPGRRYQEIKQMGAEIKHGGEKIAGSTVKASVAIVLSYDSRFAFQVQGNNPALSYAHYIQQLYRALYAFNVVVDIVAPTDDLSGYKLVIAPLLHVVTPEITANLEQFVKHGGVLLTGLRSGAKDEANAIVNMRLPGLLQQLIGAEVEEYDSLTDTMSNALRFVLPGLLDCTGSATLWCDVLKLRGAEAVACYTSDYYSGKPSISVNHYGQGYAIYCGTVGDEQLIATLVQWLIDLAGIQPASFNTNKGELEITRRWQGDKPIDFILNHSDSPQQIEVKHAMTDLLTGATIAAGELSIQAKDIFVLG